MKYSYFGAEGMQGFAMCGNGGPYQVNVQRSLNPSIRLLEKTPEGEVGHDPKLNALADFINKVFQEKAVELLLAKRAKLANDGEEDIAKRLEVTIFLTDRGLQIGYSVALPVKEIAPTPHKQRGLFGWPRRSKTFVPPLTEKDADLLEREMGIASTTAVATPTRKVMPKP